MLHNFADKWRKLIDSVKFCRLNKFYPVKMWIYNDSLLVVTANRIQVFGKGHNIKNIYLKIISTNKCQPQEHSLNAPQPHAPISLRSRLDDKKDVTINPLVEFIWETQHNGVDCS